MNFHYQNQHKNQHLLEELKEIEYDLENKHKQLEEKRKLQEQFYEDSYQKPIYQNPVNQHKNQPPSRNYRNDLADQIMNQLLMGNKSDNARTALNVQPEANNGYQQPIINSPPKASNMQIQNKRQMEKQKLQNQNMIDDYPFGKHSASKEHKNKVYSPPKQLIDRPERDYYAQPPIPHQPKQKIDNSPTYNPFIQNDEILKQKRQQQERHYRKLLQEQMAQQKAKRSVEKQRHKAEYNQNFNNYVPNAQPQVHIQSREQEIFVHKRRDPNASPPKYSLQRNQSQDDINYMKMQVSDLKMRLKKGRISQQEYQRDLNKLERHYGCKLDSIQENVSRKYENKSKSPNNYSEQPNQANPFIKNSEYQKQQRQQKEKRYRRGLEQQMEEQRKRKDKQKQKYKQQYNQTYNNYVPVGSQNQQSEQQPQHQELHHKKKKRDPNGQFPKYEVENHKNDLNFMKMQVSELKMKLNKGRIHVEQYEREIKKLQQHYGKKVEELTENVNNLEIQPQSYSRVTNANNHEEDNHGIEEDNNRATSPPPVPLENKFSPYHPNIPGYPYQPENMHPDSAQKYSYYPTQLTNQSGYSNNNSEAQFQMMFKLFEGLRQIIQLQQKSQESMLSQKKFLEETFSKFNPYLLMNTMQMHQMNMNPNQINQLQQMQQQQLSQLQNMQNMNQMQNNNQITQQVPPNIQPNNREFQTDKKYDNYTKNSYQKQIGNSASSIHPHDSSDNSVSYSYLQSNIDKSLSGIVNKIPLTSKQKQLENDNNNRDIVKFYSRKYRVAPCRQFQYFDVEKKDKKKPIPSVSNYIQINNAQQQLETLFQSDLLKYKKIQKEKELEMIKSKLESSKQQQKRSEKPQLYHYQQHKEERNGQNGQKKPSKGEQAETVNPFLKKHISNQSEYQQIPTFHEEELGYMKGEDQFISSPIVTGQDPKSSEILEQQQYQTEPRKASPAHPQPKRASQESKKDNPSEKILKVMRSNNQLLNRYLQTPSPSRNQQIQSVSSIQQSIERQQSKQKIQSQGKLSMQSPSVESRDYFESRDISPVQHRNYQSSLQTVRSEEQSARRNSVNIGMGLPSSRVKSSQYQSINLHRQARQEPQYERNEEQDNEVQRNNFQPEYCATVESVEESASKLPVFFNKPPIHRKLNKSSTRKKQGVVKLSTQNSIYKSNLSGIPSQGSRQKIQSSVLLKPPTYSQEQGNQSGTHFDSNIYQSAYEESPQKSRRINHRSIEEKEEEHSPEKEEEHSPEKEQQQYIYPNLKKYEDSRQQSDQIVNKQNNNDSINNSNNSGEGMVPQQPKWKSLEQARRIAREFRQKSGENNTRKSVEQKLSEFQSFIHSTKKKDDSSSVLSRPGFSGFGDESMLKNKQEIQEKERCPQTQKTVSKKKNIMDILNGLDEEGENQYQMNFESYREESET